MPEFEPIIGRYLSVDIDGAPHRVHVEEAGHGVPLLWRSPPSSHYRRHFARRQRPRRPPSRISRATRRRGTIWRPAAPVESAAYFAVAEALTNVVKHARSSAAWVSLTHLGGALYITVGFLILTAIVWFVAPPPVKVRTVLMAV